MTMRGRFLTMKRALALLAWGAIALGGVAQIRCLEPEHDFGAFNEDDGKVRTEFRFVNESDGPVSILKVRSSCGCTVPEYSRKPIQPGDTATVTAVYNPTGRPGRFSKSLVAYFDDDTQQRLLIKGVVIGAQNTLRSRFPVEDGPVRLRGTMIPFGTVKSGKVKSHFMDVYNASREPVVPYWTDVPKYLRITAAHDTILPGEQGVYSMVVAPTREVPYGILTDSVAFNVPGQPPLKIEIAAIVEEDFSGLTEKQLAEAPKVSVSTDMLDFGEFQASDSPMVRTFTITNNGKSDLMLRRVYTGDTGFDIAVPKTKVKKGKSVKITVTFNPALFQAPLLNGRMQVITNDPDRPLTTVRLVGIPRQ